MSEIEPTDEEIQKALSNLKPSDLVAKYRTDMGIDLPEVQHDKVLYILDWSSVNDQMRLKTFGEHMTKADATSDNTKEFVAFLCNTMYANNGIGMAATQVDVPLRLFVIDCLQDRDHGKAPRVIINPELTSFDNKVTTTEGCLSTPGLPVQMQRWNTITVKGKDLNWNEIEYIFDGLEAHAVQHEMDHLVGLCIVDTLSPLKRDMYARKMAKVKRHAKAIAKKMYDKGITPNG